MTKRTSRYMGPWLRLNNNGVEYFEGGHWILLSGNDAWNVITMLRGPDSGDNEHHTLKALITARVRGLFWGWDDASPSSSWLVGGLVISPPRTLTDHEKHRLKAVMEKAPVHFLNHWNEAEKVVREIWHRWPYPVRGRR